REAVTGQPPSALTGLEGDAGNIAQDIAQARGALRLHDLLRDHRDRLRYVARGLREFRCGHSGSLTGDFDELSSPDVERHALTRGEAEPHAGANEHLIERLFRRHQAGYTG